MSKNHAHEILLDVMEEKLLLIGGVASGHGLSDAAVQDLVRGLDAIRERALRRLHSRSRHQRVVHTPIMPQNPVIESAIRQVQIQRRP